MACELSSSGLDASDEEAALDRREERFGVVKVEGCLRTDLTFFVGDFVSSSSSLGGAEEARERVRRLMSSIALRGVS